MALACILISLAISSTKGQIPKWEKQRGKIWFFNNWIIFSAGSLLASKIFTISHLESSGILVSGQRQQRLWENGICITRKLGNPVFVPMLHFKTEVKMTVPEKAKLYTHIKKNTIFFKDNLFSLVSSETERWMECLGALCFKTDLFCVHDLYAAIQNVYTHQEMS